MSQATRMKTILTSASLLAAVATCTTTNPGVEGTQSLRITLVTPADPGDLDHPLPDGERTITVSIEALDEQGEVDTSFDRDVDVYAQFLGGLTPQLGKPPLATVPLVAGESGEVIVELPVTFGPTYLWFEDGDEGPAQDGASTWATGTSPTLYYRAPFIEDAQRPPDETALSALDTSPLQDKQLSVIGSRHGLNGRLVISSIYAQGYTLDDVACQDADGTPPCVAGDYDHLLIFSFSRPRDDKGNTLEVGQAITGFAGSVQEFNGLTEIGFPQTFVEGAPDVDAARISPPVLVDPSWFVDTINFERNEAGLLEIADATVCPLDDAYTDFKQWKLDLGSGCDDNSISVITSGTVTDFDPAAHVGDVLPSVVGTLRPVNIGTFNVWILFPRDGADLTLS